MAGDGDGNMSAIANERLGLGSCGLLGSVSGLGVDGGMTVWNPMAVHGRLRFNSWGPILSAGTLFDAPPRIEVASKSVGGPLAFGILLPIGSFRFAPEFEVRFRLKPSLVGGGACVVKYGSQVSGDSSDAGWSSRRTSNGIDWANRD